MAKLRSAYLGIDFLDSLPFWDGSSRFDLSRTQILMEALGNPQDRVKTIHVAGTNGKGSVSTAAAAILGAAGFKVGLITSPHLQRINERIVIDGLAIADYELSAAALMVQEACQDLSLVPSFFEAVIASSFVALRDCDYVVVEVGLGGRLDATNVIRKPEITIISTIGWDHERILGNSLGAIAYEKAGIVKAGVPLVVGWVPSEALGVISRVAQEKGLEKGAQEKSEEKGARFIGAAQEGQGKGARFLRAAHEFDISEVEAGGELSQYRLNIAGGQELTYCSALRGRHQAANMALAIVACLELGVAQDFCRVGVGQLFWPGRLEELRLENNRRAFLDCAHNVDGVLALTSFLESNSLSCDMAVGFLSDKNWQAMVDMLLPYARNWYLLRPPGDRALASGEIASYLKARGCSAFDYDNNYADLLDKISGQDNQTPLLFVGSIYLIGIIRDTLDLPLKPLWRKVPRPGGRPDAVAVTVEFDK